MSMLFPDLLFYSSKKCMTNFSEEQVKMVANAEHDVELATPAAAHTNLLCVDSCFTVLQHRRHNYCKVY